MNWYEQFFQVGQIPAHVMHGEYNLMLVLLSYIIASVASYVALDMSSHLKKQNTPLFRICWWSGGAIVMGAGIWSMHFVGMLAFRMDMPMTYDLFWTGLSMIVAIITAGIAFSFFIIKKPRTIHYIMSGIILGTAIPTMHYLGMAGMDNMTIRYRPGIFCLSILVAVIAATAALWLSVYSDKGTYAKRIRLKLGSALIMGVAIAGMHYTGMAAAVFSNSGDMVGILNVDPTLMGILITTIVLCIMSIALILSSTKYYVATRLQNDKDFLEVVLNNLRGGVIAFDSNKKIRLYNKAIQNLYGNIESLKDLSTEWETHLPLLKLQNKEPYSKDEYPLELIFAGNKIKGMEAIITNHDNKEKVLSMDGQQLIGQENEQLGAVIVYQDITERK